MADFRVFGKAVKNRFVEMTRDSLFLVNSDRDKIWETYLGSFPEGTDPIFRTHREHDCSCCRNFVRNIGPVVSIQNGRISSIWDLNGLPTPYQQVADAMSAYVKSLPIRDVFLTPEKSFGEEKTWGMIKLVDPEKNEEVGGDKTIQFNHFQVDIPRQFVTKDAVERCGFTRTAHQVFTRGLEELKPWALSTVVELINKKAIYRGEEFKTQVIEFQRLQDRWAAADTKSKECFAWAAVNNSVARFRNTVIGTLVQDLSSGVDLEAAVRSFESKVAPLNYKRTSSLITRSMIDSAMKTIQELDIEQSLERRHARLSDVSVNSVLFVDNAVQGQMKDGIKGLLMEEVKPVPFDPKNTEEIGIDKFVSDILPKVGGLQLYLENGALGNFVSMTAPVHADSKSLFRWSNDFAWSYDGNVTDSIKEKVKRAGGQVDNVALRVSLAWFNTDDLDLHVQEERYNDHIFYANKVGKSGGKLDVDMNVASTVRDPVENVRWVRMPGDGTYKVIVNNFRKRESIDVGFVVEVESPYGIETFRYEKSLGAGVYRHIVDINVSRGKVNLVPAKGMIVGVSSQEKWGLKTLSLVRVNSVVLSPNYWDDNSVGNKHWFFILEGCKNPEPTRGIYNEFLHPKLEKHRKVFEVLGDKTKCPVADEQLSGLGFSSTRRDKVTVVATGRGTASRRLNKAYTIVF